MISYSHQNNLFKRLVKGLLLLIINGFLIASALFLVNQEAAVKMLILDLPTLTR